MEAGSSAAHGFERGDLVAHRIRAWVQVADEHRTAIRLDDLTDLLPDEGPGTPGEVASWLAVHPSHGYVVGDRVHASAPPSPAEMEARRARGVQYLREAAELWDRPLRSARRLVLAANVTGSTAYGEPESGDDLDLMVITRTGAVWLFLAHAYLVLRFRRTRGTAPPCLNYILDRATAEGEFHRPQGVMFAREALTARPVVGDAYYRAMIAAAPWMRSELPRLYGRWTPGGAGPVTDTRAAPWAARLLNAAIFPILATYLQLQGLVPEPTAPALGELGGGVSDRDRAGTFDL